MFLPRTKIEGWAGSINRDFPYLTSHHLFQYFEYQTFKKIMGQGAQLRGYKGRPQQVWGIQLELDILELLNWSV